MRAGSKAGPKKGLILDRVKKAEADITIAEHELDGVLRAVAVLPRAQKTTISKAVRDAFDRLRDAKVNLLDLETVLRKEN